MAKIKKYRKEVDGNKLDVFGASADLLEWVRTSPLAQKLLAKTSDHENLLFVSLGHHLEQERVRAASRLMTSLWTSFPELGPYVLGETLIEFQFDRRFYSDYRDHSVHQLKVLLLGLMMYDKCVIVKDRIHQEIALTNEEHLKNAFIKRWLATALFHDVGYVLENEDVHSQGETWKKTKQELDESLAAPVSLLPAFKSRLTRAAELDVCQTHGIPEPKTLSPDSLGKFRGDSLFEYTNPEGVLAGLAANPNFAPPVKLYYDFAKSHIPHSRKPFFDHGIVSGLLLLHVWKAFEERVIKLTSIGSEPLLATVREDLKDLASLLKLEFSNVRAAAAAIALHNINKGIWRGQESAAIDCGLNLDQFCIRLTAADATPPSGPTPLAFLLALCDSLQDWDRSVFRPMNKKDNFLYDQDVSITATTNNVQLFLREDSRKLKDPATDPASRYNSGKREMKNYLEPSAIDTLLHWGSSKSSARDASRPRTSLKTALLDANDSKPTVHIPRITVLEPDIDLIGRHQELCILQQCWDTRKPTVFCIWGDAGVGKTYLLARFVDSIILNSQKDLTVYWHQFPSKESADLTVSSSLFFNHAIRTFGYAGDLTGTEQERAHLLTNLIRKRKSLLILDGVENLQRPSVRYGRLLPQERAARCMPVGTHVVEDSNPINDSGDFPLASFLSEIARCGLESGGMILIGSRYPLADLKRFKAGYGEHHLRGVSDSHGAEILSKQDVVPLSDYRLEKLSAQLGGNPLAILLVGSLIRNKFLDLTRFSSSQWLVDETEGKTVAEKAMIWHDQFLSTKERAFLRLLGLFGRPMTWDDFDILCSTHTAATATLRSMDADDLNALFASLADYNLLVRSDDTLSAWNGWDTHALVRQYFGWQLRRRSPKAWREAHQVLFRHFSAAMEAYCPAESSEQLGDMFGAVRHGILAGQFRDTYRFYRDKIAGDWNGYDTEKHGEVSEALNAVSSILRGVEGNAPDKRQDERIEMYDQTWLLARASYCYVCQGRLVEAMRPREISNMMFEQLFEQSTKGSYEAFERSRDLAFGYEELAGIQMQLGRLKTAEETAEKAVFWARKAADCENESRDALSWVDGDSHSVSSRLRLASTLSALGAVLHRRGKWASAASHFQEAIRVHGERILHSEPGFRYCLFELDRASCPTDCYEVLKHADKMLEWSVSDASPHNTETVRALHEIVRGRALLELGRFVEAETALNQAVQLMSRSHKSQFLVDPLLIRAFLLRVVGRQAEARSDIQEALDRGIACKMALCQADALLLRCHLALDTYEHAGAKEDASWVNCAITDAEANIRNARRLIRAQNDDNCYRLRLADLKFIEARLAFYRAPDGRESRKLLAQAYESLPETGRWRLHQDLQRFQRTHFGRMIVPDRPLSVHSADQLCVNGASDGERQPSLFYISNHGALQAVPLHVVDGAEIEVERFPYGAVVLPGTDREGNIVIVFKQPSVEGRSDVLLIEKPAALRMRSEVIEETLDPRKAHRGRSRVRVMMRLLSKDAGDTPASVAIVRVLGDLGPGRESEVPAREQLVAVAYTFRVGDKPGWFEAGEDSFPDPAFCHGHPDIATREQREAGIRGPSWLAMGLDSPIMSSLFVPRRARPVGPGERAIYELHLGTFSPEGTFTGAIDRLKHVKHVGFTTVQLMPVDIASGSPGWSYDQARTGAVERFGYGGAEGLIRFVEQAHALGLEVIVDKQYNHQGPEQDSRGEIISGMFGRHTRWGAGLSGRENRNFEQVLKLVGEELAYWVCSYGLDGFRFDATNRLPNEFHQWLGQFGQALQEQVGKPIYLISEYAESEKPRGLRAPTGHQYADQTGRLLMRLLDLSKAAHVVKLPHDGGSTMKAMLKAARRGWWYPNVPAPEGGLSGTERSTTLLWNHDWIGNRFGGERISQLLSFSSYKVIVVWQLLGQWTPFVFMGAERYSRTPWYFFTGHQDVCTRNNTSAYYQEENGVPALKGGRFHEFRAEAERLGLREPLAFSRDETLSGIDWRAFRDQYDAQGRPYLDHAKDEAFLTSKMDWQRGDHLQEHVEDLFRIVLAARADERIREASPQYAQYKGWEECERVFVLRRKDRSEREFVALFNLSDEAVNFGLVADGVFRRDMSTDYIVGLNEETREDEWHAGGRYSLWINTEAREYGGSVAVQNPRFDVFASGSKEVHVAAESVLVFSKEPL